MGSTISTVLLEDLCVELAGHKKTADKLDFIDSFQNDELRSNLFTYGSKINLITDILDDKTVFDKKEQGINKVIGSFSGEESSQFIGRLLQDTKFFNRLMDKINGEEKNDLVTMLDRMTFSNRTATKGQHRIPEGREFSATYKNGAVEVKSWEVIAGHSGDWKKINEKTESLFPFATVECSYKGENVLVPAIALLSPAVIFECHYRESLEWDSLSETEKEKYF